MTDGPGPPISGLWARVPERYRPLLILVIVGAIVALALVFQERLPKVETLGYPAIFVISVLGNATLFFPVPVILAVCVGGTLLNPLLAGLIGGAGQAIGEGTGYLAGFSGSGLLRESGWYGRVRPWVERRGWVVVMVIAAIPNPMFDIVGMVAGAMRMPLWQFFGAVWIGKTVRSVAVAYGCALGYDFLRALGGG